MEQKFDTRLVFEILRSDLLPKVQRCIRRRIGEFTVIREFEKDGALVRAFANRGVPIVFEIAEAQNGKLSLHRERPAFFWDSHWEEFFGAWIEADENAAGGAEYQDGVMWNRVMPGDLAFNVIAKYWGGHWNGEEDDRPVAGFFSVFRPETHRSWDGLLDIDTVKLNTAPIYVRSKPMPVGPFIIGREEPEYLNAYRSPTGAGREDRQIEMISKYGFIHDASLELVDFKVPA